jgi:GT2 family glycosyltransferase
VGGNRKRPSYNVVATYDHVTPLNHQGELPRCLASLRDNGVDVAIYILVASEAGIEGEASDKIQVIAEAFRDDMTVHVIDNDALSQFYTRADMLGYGAIREGVGLTGYSAIRNLGLLTAAAGGFTECIFIDDDEIVTEPDFLEKAVYGLGKLTQKGVPVLVKSGYYTNSDGEWKSKQKGHWYDRYWQQGELFNKWITKAMSASRLSRSNSLYGGLTAIHREAYRRVSFDPWIPRGEDLDYLLNVRMYGGDVWFDNHWSINHLPPANRNEAQRFRQDIYRWIYEHRKLEYAKSQIDLLPIQPQTLSPYPGPFLEHSVSRRIFLTALLRVLGRPRDRKGYFKAAMAARREAKAYAEVFCSKYYEFQMGWPQIVAALESDPVIRHVLAGTPLPTAAPAQPHPENAYQPQAQAEQQSLTEPAGLSQGAAANIDAHSGPYVMHFSDTGQIPIQPELAEPHPDAAFVPEPHYGHARPAGRTADAGGATIGRAADAGSHSTAPSAAWGGDDPMQQPTQDDTGYVKPWERKRQLDVGLDPMQEERSTDVRISPQTQSRHQAAPQAQSRHQAQSQPQPQPRAQAAQQQSQRAGTQRQPQPRPNHQPQAQPQQRQPQPQQPQAQPQPQPQPDPLPLPRKRQEPLPSPSRGIEPGPEPDPRPLTEPRAKPAKPSGGRQAGQAPVVERVSARTWRDDEG